MRKAIFTAVLLLAFCAFCGHAAGAAPSHWATGEVNEAIELNIVPDALKGQYKAPITRGEFCKLIVRTLTEKKEMAIGEIMRERGVTATNTFADTSDKDILAANALGIVYGIGKDRFAPSQEITRQEAAAMLVRAASLIGDIGDAGDADLDYADSKDIAPWAIESVKTASVLRDLTNNKPLMGGTGENKFAPLSPYTREQAIVTAKRLFFAFPDEPYAFPFKFTGEDIYGNRATEESIGKKELFFVHYWATWCDPCINEMPDLAKVAKKYGDRVGFIALLDDFENKSSAIKIAENADIPFIIVDGSLNELKSLKKMLTSGYVPTSAIIDGKGKMIGEQIVGTCGEGYGQFIEAALAGGQK